MTSRNKRRCFTVRDHNAQQSLTACGSASVTLATAAPAFQLAAAKARRAVFTGRVFAPDARWRRSPFLLTLIEIRSRRSVFRGSACSFDHTARRIWLFSLRTSPSNTRSKADR